jgi:hypothetical protein
MTVPTIADLLTPPSADDIEGLLLAYLQVAANPITDWNSGAVQRIMLKVEKQIIVDLLGPGTPPALQSALAGLLANGYHDSATDSDSLETLAHGWYGLDVVDGTFAVQTVTLSCDGTHGPYSFTAGLQEGLASDGALYVAAGSGTLSSGGSLALDFHARSVGLAKALISQLARPLPGVTVASAAIKVVTGVPQFGSDPEPDADVRAAIAGRFPDLAALGTEDRVITWAKASDPTITRCRLDPDVNTPGAVILTVAGVSGPVGAGVVTAAAAYILVRQPITDVIEVDNAITASVTPGGTVTVRAARLAEVQAEADAAWSAYLASSQIGASVYLLQLIQAVMDAGADNFVSPTLNGLGQDLGLASHAVPVPAGTLAALLTWVSI